MKAVVSVLLSWFLLQISPCWALEPGQVVVVANRMAWHSVELAEYYMKVRNIPSGNLVKIRASGEEVCSREDYDREIAGPVREFLKKHDPEGEKFHCLVTMFGVPLKVLPPKLTPEEERDLLNLAGQYESLAEKIKTTDGEKDPDLVRSLRQDQEQLKRKIDKGRKVFQVAAVDSELALVREDAYPLEGWLPNRFFLGYRGRTVLNMPRKAMMGSRLDGPTMEVVRRIIDDSIQVEKEGLKGKAYFDARWPDPGEGDKEVKDYAFYDRAIHNAGHLVERSKRMAVTVDSQERLFQPGECPEAALYCGWYSLARYVDAFTWVKGAVGFHIASSECATLRDKGSQVWCKMMLEKGAAATLGPVAEPYVQAFPVPDLFFRLLIEGNFTLAECFAFSNPFWSWQMVLIGDPLYTPFKNRTED